MNGDDTPIHLRVTWWAMVRFERAAQWCRARYVKWHKTRGVVLPSGRDRG